MNNNNLTYYQLNKEILKLKLKNKFNNPEYKEKRRQYERQYYHNKRKLININKLALLNNNNIPEYMLKDLPIVKIELGPIIIEL
jgi:hypothetical protein